MTYSGAFVTMATAECAAELALHLASLRSFHPCNPVIIGATTELRSIFLDKDLPVNTSSCRLSPSEMNVIVAVREYLRQSPSAAEFVCCLDQYGAISRRRMERTPGCWFATRHTDFMMEKANLLEWTLAGGKADVAMFLDCDSVLLAPHPAVSDTSVLGLSPHCIRPVDERLFGRFNGGYLWTRSPDVLVSWRKHTRTSRYFDQASLEDVARDFDSRLTLAPPQINYGYWRMFQSERPLSAELALFDTTPGAPLRYMGDDVVSVHSHFFLRPAINRPTELFNRLVATWSSQAMIRASSATPLWDAVRAAMAEWVVPLRRGAAVNVKR